MPAVDRHGKLKEKPFSFQQAKNGKVFLFWRGKQIMLLKGESAERFLKKMAQASEEESQLLMAKVTGNFKHGNEK